MSATKQQSFAPPPLHSGAVWLQLRADFELDKGKAVSRALANVQRETERARRQAGERSGDELRDEMARLAAKHRSDVSASKKKQWVSHGGAGGRGGAVGRGGGGGTQRVGGRGPSSLRQIESRCFCSVECC